MKTKKVKQIRNIDKIISILEKHFNPTERTTLNRMRKEKKLNPFKILIACLLSLRTQDKNTEKASKRLFAVASNPQAIAKLPLKKLEKLIYSSGHYKKKSKTLKHVSQDLLNRFNGKVPNTEQELLSIKGIGRKTANIVLAFAYGKDAIPVDVHVHVISNRLGWVSTKNADKTEKELVKIIPGKYWKELNALLVLFGKEICITISPKCSICLVRRYCPRINVQRSR